MKEAFRIHSGSRLHGEIQVRGAKNFVLKVMAASVLFDGPIEIENVPMIEDVFRMSELLTGLGVRSTKLVKGGGDWMLRGCENIHLIMKSPIVFALQLWRPDQY